MTNAIIHISPDPEALAQRFARDFFAWLPEKDSISIALSGGSTPKLLFKILAHEYADKIDWSRIHFFWGDERCVPPDQEESNFRMTRELLLDHITIPAENIHRIKGENKPQEEATRYADEIQRNVFIKDKIPVFDLILLGMGSDGHTASIFPDQMHLLNENGVCKVATHPDSGQQRITLTGRVINQAHRVVFLVTGESKSLIVAKILRQEEDWESYPAAHIHPIGALYWYLDEAAAKGYKGRLD